MKTIFKQAATVLAGVLIAGLPAFGAPPAQPAPGHSTAHATFAGGCFWCMVHPFDQLPGVISVTSGYTGGAKKKPSYAEVSSGTTGHAESVDVVYDPARIGYEKLLDVYWHNVDPFAKNYQFCDHGTQYRSAIFVHDETQKRLAEAAKAEIQKRFKQPIQTEITPASAFWPAEDEHQDYYKKNPVRYKFYRTSCGRDHRLREIWGTSGGD
jgi:peptide-methionine (S)-S-oxide reductase